MIRKIIGAILLILGVLVTLVLFTYGGPIFPHIIGPIAFVALGVFLFFFKREGK